MKLYRRISFVLLFLTCVFSQGPAIALPMDRLILPEGFEIGIFARVPGARQMVLGPDGVVFVGSRREGRVFMLRDSDLDGRADVEMEIASGLNNPNGVTMVGDDLYVAEIHRIISYPRIIENLGNSMEPVEINASLPADKWHGWKYLRLAPALQYFPDSSASDKGI